jgi:hypothetical protein
MMPVGAIDATRFAQIYAIRLGIANRHSGRGIS